MDFDSEVKAAIKELPPAQRVIAVRLKTIFNEVKQLLTDQESEIKENHLKFVGQFRDIEQKAGQVIQGKPIEESQLFEGHSYFSSEQQHEKEQIMKKGSKINDYWLKTLKKTAVASLITEKDEQILKNLRKISTNLSLEALSITFEFFESPLLKEGQYTRKLTLNDKGIPVNFDGDEMNFNEEISQSFFETISTNTKQEQVLENIFGFLSEFINEIVPYSLQYFVGVCENEAVSESFEGADEDSEGQEPEKRRKPFQ